MAHSEEHYRAAAHSLGEGFLGSQFGQSSLDDAAVSKVHRVAEFQENALLMSRDNGSIAGVLERGAQAAKSITEAKKRQDERAKRSADNVLFLNMLDQRIADLDFRMGELEERLVAEFGEDWGQQVALEVLDPDEMPQRRDGESMADYEARVDAALAAEFLDEDGNVKPEYKDHPRYGDAAQFMEHKLDREAATELRAKLNDPNTSSAEAAQEIEDFSETASYYRMQIAQQELATNEAAQTVLQTNADERNDTEESRLAYQSADDAFLSGFNG